MIDGPHQAPTIAPRLLAEMAVATALAVVLGLFKLKLPHLLYGGSISLHALPIFVIAIRHGVRRGILIGVAYSAVNFALGPFFLHPLQVMLDYPLAFGALGMAGLSRSVWPLTSSTDNVVSGRILSSSRLGLAGSIILASAVRFGMHFSSGMLYFAHLAPEGTSVWQFSVVYNASYIVPETLICLVAIQIPQLQPLLARQARSSSAS